MSRQPIYGEVNIESLAHDGRGIGRVNGKTVFVHGALPGEVVQVQVRRRRKDFDEGEALAVLSSAAERVTPRCAHFGVCGGCALQHLDPAAQIRAKEKTLLDNLARIGKVAPSRVLPPLTGPVWGYRRRARLGVKYVKKKGRVLVGFRERETPFIADLRRCEVLAPKAGLLLEPLAVMLGTLSVHDRVPQIEVAVADNATALVLRVLDVPAGRDLAIMREFATQHDIAFYLQPGGYETVTPLDPEQPSLYYHLPRHSIRMEFRPTDFIQINAEVNAALVDLALELLAPETGQRVLDLFCGLGNFTLPLSRYAAGAVGVEGDAALVARARRNAADNKITNAEFHSANLFEAADMFPWARQRYDGVLLDPPRAGAREILAQFPQFGATRVVYVSCHPGTLARDAGILVNEQGYELAATGVLDMFPHTAHVESIAVFEK